LHYQYCSYTNIKQVSEQESVGFTEGDIVEIGFSVVAFKGNRDSKGFCMFGDELIGFSGWFSHKGTKYNSILPTMLRIHRMLELPREWRL
jgi:hypothetical protein